MDGSDGVGVPETLRRCSCCEVRRPLWAFGKKASGLHNACRACSAGNLDRVSPMSLKRAGRPLEEIQALANERMDRIRARELRSAFSMEAHLARKRLEGVQVDLESLVPTNNPPARHAPAPLPLAPRVIAPETVLVTNQGQQPAPDAPVVRTKRISKGALAREEKERRHRERMRKIEEQQAGLDLEALRESTKDELRASFIRTLRGAKSRRNGRRYERPLRTKENPWADVHLTERDYEELYSEARAAGYVFFEKPEGHVGMWLYGASPDRKNPADPRYVRENLRMVPWIENSARGQAHLDAVDQYMRFRMARLGVRDVSTLSDLELAAECRRRGLRDPRQLDLFGGG